MGGELNAFCEFDRHQATGLFDDDEGNGVVVVQIGVAAADTGV